MYIPKLEDYYKAVEDGMLSMHETEDLVGFKYNIHTTFNKLWNDVTINARGITFDKHTGKIVARPFRKFFNHSEFITIDHVATELYDIVPQEYRPNLSGPFRVMDKLDGFLAITFYNPYTAKWQIKTGGSFTAKQSDWAQEWFNDCVNDSKMNVDNTYLFEGIWSGDRHVVKYDYEALKLLAVIPNATGNELPLNDIRQAAEDMGVQMAEVKNYINFQDMLKEVADYPATLEGVVVTFDNGYKCKVKGIQYCEMFMVLNNLTEREIFMRYDPVKDIVYANVNPCNGYRPLNDEVLVVPEELPEISDYVNILKTRMHVLFETVLSMAKEIDKLGIEGKELYDTVCKRWENKKEFIGPTMSAIKSLRKGDTEFAASKIALKKLLR